MPKKKKKINSTMWWSRAICWIFFNSFLYLNPPLSHSTSLYSAIYCGWGVWECGGSGGSVGGVYLSLMCITQAIQQPTSPFTLLGTTATGTCVTGQGPELTFGDDLLVGCRIPVPTFSDSTTCSDFASSILKVSLLPTHPILQTFVSICVREGRGK